MEENEVMENIEPTIDEAYTELEDASGIGKWVLGAGAVATGIVGGIAYKNREKIKGKFEEFKETRRVKKVEKTMKKLAALEAKAPKKETEE